MTTLNTRLAQLQGRFATDVRALSAQEVAVANESAAAQVADVQQRHVDQVLAGIRYIEARAGLVLQLEDWPTLADLLGIEVGILLQTGNRHSRRQTNKKIKTKLEMERAPSWQVGLARRHEAS